MDDGMYIFPPSNVQKTDWNGWHHPDGGGKQKAGLQVEQVSATSKEKDTSLQPTPYHHGEDDAGGLELTDEEGGALMITEDSDADQPDEDELV